MQPFQLKRSFELAYVEAISIRHIIYYLGAVQICFDDVTKIWLNRDNNYHYCLKFFNGYWSLYFAKCSSICVICFLKFGGRTS